MSGADKASKPEAGASVALGPIDFSTHILSLASSAMCALGAMPAPGGETMELDLESAHHLIDVLGMLEVKTKGNLDESEQKLLQSLLYDLRVAYVDAQKPR
jgi:hypothetical protein